MLLSNLLKLMVSSYGKNRAHALPASYWEQHCVLSNNSSASYDWEKLHLLWLTRPDQKAISRPARGKTFIQSSTDFRKYKLIWSTTAGLLFYNSLLVVFGRTGKEGEESSILLPVTNRFWLSFSISWLMMSELSSFNLSGLPTLVCRGWS